MAKEVGIILGGYYSIRFLQAWVLFLVTSTRYLCFICLPLAAIAFFVISSERSCGRNLELPQILIVLVAEEKTSNNAFTT
jgi:hypothetical protein